MSTLADNVRDAWHFLEKNGPVYLYALFERDDAPNKWDLLIASSWSDKNSPEVIRALSAQIVPKLSQEDKMELSRIVTVPSTAPVVSLMNRFARIENGRVEMSDVGLGAFSIKHAIVFRSVSPNSEGKLGAAEAPIAHGT